jgi:LmbE family N-acetylglucosaminyl deacetylase
VITFGPDGISGHPHHIAVGRATDRTYARLARGNEPGPRRLLHIALPQSGFDDINAQWVGSGFEPLDPTRPYWPRGVPDDDIDITVDLRDVWPRTRAAMRAHRSQWAPPWSEFDDEGWRRSAGARHLVQKSPARDRAAGRLRSIFEGLDHHA